MLLRWDQDVDATLARHPRLKQIYHAVENLSAVQQVLANQPPKH